MQYSRISDRPITTKLIVDSSILMTVVPDFGTTVTDILPQLNINYSNLYSQNISIKPLRIGSTVINPRTYYLYSKEDESDISRTISSSTHNSIPKNKFSISDQTAISNMLSELSASYGPKVLAQHLATILKYNFQANKVADPKLKQLLIFQCKDQSGLYDILLNLKKLDAAELSFIDNFALVAVNGIFVPLLSINKTGIVEVNPVAFLTINSQLKKIEPEEPATKIEQSPIEKEVKVDDKIENDHISRIESAQYTRALDGVIINNPVIATNVQNLLANSVIHQNREILSEKIFKKIHKTLHGSGDIKPEIKANPKLLIKQMLETTSFNKTIIDYPEPSHNIHALAPNDVLKIKTFTGPVRHQFEFNDSIHKDIHHLFSSLANDPTNPVKIVDFKYEYKDDDLNRFIEYTITVKNMAGGRSPNYDIKLKIPALVNEKYFKLNGNNYILSNQQFLVPITKDNQNEARFITHYNMARLSTVNLKFNTHQIREILAYVTIKYPIIIKSSEKNSKGELIKMEFNDGLETKIDLTSHVPFANLNKSILFDRGEYSLLDDKGNIINEKISKNEYIYDSIVDILGQIDSNEKLKRTRKSISFLRIHIMGRKLPLILFMWQQCGLLNTLVKYNIDYEIGVTPKTNPFFTLALQNDRKLFLYPDNIREQLIVNGLFVVYKLLEGLTEKDLHDQSKIELIIDNKYGTKTSAMFNLAVKTFIDPTTKSLLEYEEKPTDLIGIVDGPLLDKLLNSEPDDPADLKNLRVRQSEIIAHLLYRETAMSMNKYKQDLAYGIEDAHMFMQPDYVINNLLGKHAHSGDAGGGNMLSFTNTFSPIDEITISSRVIKTGVGGIPSLRAFSKNARDIGPDQAIAISACGTSEYASVGAVNTHSLQASISDRHGTYLHRDINDSQDHMDSLGMAESLVPWLSTMDSDRLILAVTHMSQKVPIKNGEIPLVSTGSEYIAGQLASEKFVINAKKTGKVLEIVDDKYMVVQYSDGSKDTLNLLPRYAATKRNSIIRNKMNTLKVGEDFQKDQMVAYTNSFNGDGLAIGKNVTMAIMNYNSYSHEDGYVLTEDSSNKFILDSVEKVIINIPPNTKVISINSEIGTVTSVSDVLVEFEYANSIDDYINKYEVAQDFQNLDHSQDQDGSETEEIEEDPSKYLLFQSKTSQSIYKKSPGGRIIDFRIRIASKNQVDGKLISLWNDQKKHIQDIEAKLLENKSTSQDKLIDNLDFSLLKTGSTKFEGAQLEFYIEKEKPLRLGDKMANRFGAKGVVSSIISKENAPRGEFSGNIDVFLAPVSVLGRKNTCIIKELFLGKIIHYIPIYAKQRLVRNEDMHTLIDFIISIYEVLDPTKDKRISKSIAKRLNSLDEKLLRTAIETDVFRFNFIMPAFSPVDLKQIKKAAAMLKLPLNEFVYLPEFDQTTKTKVPVGISYMSALEQLSSDYESTRATAGYVSATGQPTVGKANNGGQAVGELDLWAFLSYDATNIIRELYTARSDNFQAKRDMIENLKISGKTSLPADSIGRGQTKKLFNVFITGMGLKIYN